jgi:hypothetical protein
VTEAIIPETTTAPLPGDLEGGGTVTVGGTVTATVGVGVGVCVGVGVGVLLIRMSGVGVGDGATEGSMNCDPWAKTVNERLIV